MSLTSQILLPTEGGDSRPCTDGTPEDQDQCFQSPIEQLLARQWETRPRRSSVGAEMDCLISSQHALRKKHGSWHHGSEQAFQEWKDDFRKVLHKALIIPAAPGRKSAPIVRHRSDHGDFVEEHVEITLTPPFRTTAIVTIPKNGRKKHPALVLLHSFGSLNLYGKEKFLRREGEPAYLTACRQECYEGQSLLADFARAGYLCIAIDAWGFGHRTSLAAKDPVGFDLLRNELDPEDAERISLKIFREEYEQTARALASVGLSISAVTAADDLRTVDYLVEREDVDTRRIGCAGLSFGSIRANYLAALDDRVRVTTSVCWLSTLDGIVDYNLPHSLGFYAIPDGLFRHFDMIDIPIAAAPKPFLAISGWEDILMEPRGIASAHLTLRRAWEAAGSANHLGSLVFDAPHEFNKNMQSRALAFFQTFL